MSNGLKKPRSGWAVLDILKKACNFIMARISHLSHNSPLVLSWCLWQACMCKVCESTRESCIDRRSEDRWTSDAGFFSWCHLNLQSSWLLIQDLLVLTLHLFVSPLPVNLAWECGASSRWWDVFPPKSKTVYTKLCLQISTLNSTSLLHNPHPPLSCFSLWQSQSLFSHFVELQPLNYELKSSPRPETRTNQCL